MGYKVKLGQCAEARTSNVHWYILTLLVSLTTGAGANLVVRGASRKIIDYATRERILMTLEQTLNPLEEQRKQQRLKAKKAKEKAKEKLVVETAPAAPSVVLSSVPRINGVPQVRKGEVMPGLLGFNCTLNFIAAGKPEVHKSFSGPTGLDDMIEHLLRLKTTVVAIHDLRKDGMCYA